jgi:hypothetical protein
MATFVNGNTCTVAGYNASPLGLCLPVVTPFTVFAQCIDIP